MKAIRDIPFVVHTQGTPVVSDQEAVVVRESPEIICLVIDMDSKHCTVASFGQNEFGEPDIIVAGTERSIHPERMQTTDGDFTVIAFPSLRGWSVFVADCCRYTVSVTLTKDTND